MEDTRVRVLLAGREVNLAQLDRETGGHGLSANEREVVAVEGSPLTAEQLDAALNAHVPTHPPPGLPSAEERIAVLEDEVRGIKQRAAEEAAKATPTAKGVAAAIAKDGAS